MFQYYVLEIQQFANGTFAHLVHTVNDQDEVKASLKGESKYYEILAAAAISNLPTHAAILMNSDCTPIMHQCYTHIVEE